MFVKGDFIQHKRGNAIYKVIRFKKYYDYAYCENIFSGKRVGLYNAGSLYKKVDKPTCVNPVKTSKYITMLVKNLATNNTYYLRYDEAKYKLSQGDIVKNVYGSTCLIIDYDVNVTVSSGTFLLDSVFEQKKVK